MPAAPSKSSKKSFSFHFSSPQKAKAIFTALEPETGHAYEKRSQTTLSLKNSRLGVSIIAQDPHALEVSKQSYSKLIQFLDGLENVINEK